MTDKKQQTLSDYLKSRDIQFPQTQVDLFQEGEQGAEALKNAAQAWSSNEAGIRAVIEHRVGKIRSELLLKAAPEEVIVLRQSLVELVSILDDFKQATAEFKRREDAQEQEGEPIEEPVVEEDDKSSM